ncbi:hypothetical protein CONPUDRAFT_95409 [Coniophora puteana RWD-64-598 SS2]|uniref:N-acetyltransferase domain-containing protein n=1 Tax=Coniophora puteana (strain RWD-64-598) TaxID=741705 RepID=A0A5M3N5J7_CONPW|nr:uncharacterized protein CONPUDRAFT_95409 [Coniophora puteana RWD-64-598 SS2]EIW86663.1 hypothetical protein CONPUDRAFT_95409 [Coniophora puteana RWD-64-598 SS2]
MRDASLRIRPYITSDEKAVRLFIGRALMEGLAEANRRSAFHPITLALWLALSAIMTQSLGWGPKPEFGWAGYLLPLPAFGCWGIALLYLLDWNNRPSFEEHTAAVLRRPDLRNILDHYSKTPPSSFFILEFNAKIVGFIAVDALGVDQDSNPEANTKDRLKSDSRSAKIRHFFVDEPYRKTNIQNDLMKHALQHTFHDEHNIREVQIESSVLNGYVRQSLIDIGFKHGNTIRNVGIYGWAVQLCTLSRAKWRECCLSTT